jgi:hypothetical protein
MPTWVYADPVMAVFRAVALLLALVAAVHGYAILIDAHAEECYYETARTGTKMSLTFQVAEGGFLDIDVSVSFFFALSLAHRVTSTATCSRKMHEFDGGTC